MEKFLAKLEQNPRLKRISIPKARFMWAIFQFFIFRSSLHKLGWFKSAWRNQSIDEKGEPIPWIVYSSIFFLKSRVDEEMEVFEYGSGNSTLWWARNAKSVKSVEYDRSWYDKMSSLVPKNSELIYQPLDKDGSYSKIITEQKGSFDIVFIDGRERVKCAEHSVSKLKERGVIIWDNSERERYQTGKDYLKSQGFKELEFKGPVPIDNMIATTSIFYREDNISDI